MPEEYVDIVDENNCVIAVKPRSYTDSIGLDALEGYIRAVWLFLVNPSGELLITRRSARKKLYPLGLDGSVVGHVSSGESFDTAMAREAQEELNLELRGTAYRCLGLLHPVTDRARAFSMIYTLNFEGAPQCNPDDIAEYYWWQPEQVIATMQGGEYGKPALAPIVQKCFIDT